MSPPYEVISADVDSFETTLVQLWTASFNDLSEESATTKIKQFYRENPAGCGAIFLLRDCSTQANIGVQTLVARSFFVQGELWTAGTMADFAVDAAHRTLGPALQLLKASIASSRNRLAFLYGLPNRKAEPIMRRAGLEPLLKMGRYGTPIRSRQYLKGKISSPLLTVIAPLVDTVLRAIAWFRLLSLGGAVSWRLAEGSDFDAIWVLGRRELIISDRSAATLCWRFGLVAKPNGSAVADGACSTPWRASVALVGPMTFGYVVWALRDGVAVIGDFLCATPLVDTGRLLAAFWHLARSKGAAAISLEFCGSSDIDDALRRAGFSLRETSPVYAVLHQSLPATTGWYLTGFDRDTD